MITLAIETSSPHASLCLAENEKLLYNTQWSTERNHDTYLFPALQNAINILGQCQLDYVLVGSGPGSYGGVRVALAAAVGISTVTNAKTVAICSWESMAEGRIHIVSDARRGGWTLRRPNGEISVITTEELQQLANNTPGIVLFTTESEQRMNEIRVRPQGCNIIPKAEGLVQVWNGLSLAEQSKRLSIPPEPIYVRPPHITEAKRKPWEIRT